MKERGQEKENVKYSCFALRILKNVCRKQDMAAQKEIYEFL